MPGGGFEFLARIWNKNAVSAESEFWSKFDRSKREGIDLELWRAIGKTDSSEQ